MGLLIIVPLLVSGYMVSIRHPFFFNRLHRFQGQLLYLQVARLGMVCLIVATILSAAILAVSKQKLHVAGHEITTDYSRYLGDMLVRLDIANERNTCATAPTHHADPGKRRIRHPLRLHHLEHLPIT